MILFLLVFSLPGIFLIIVGMGGLIKNMDDWHRGSTTLNANFAMIVICGLIASVGLIEVLTIIGVILASVFK
jgi:hypothetical protein